MWVDSMSPCVSHSGGSEKIIVNPESVILSAKVSSGVLPMNKGGILATWHWLSNVPVYQCGISGVLRETPGSLWAPECLIGLLFHAVLQGQTVPHSQSGSCLCWASVKTLRRSWLFFLSVLHILNESTEHVDFSVLILNYKIKNLCFRMCYC